MSDDNDQDARPVERQDDARASVPTVVERGGDEIDIEALQAAKRESTAALEEKAQPPVWERDDAPPGSTAGSLLVYERGEPVRVSGPTHYHHLSNGRVVAGYAGGTHHTEPGPNGGPDKITRVVAIHEG